MMLGRAVRMEPVSQKIIQTDAGAAAQRLEEDLGQMPLQFAK